jgi:hypothetical protein
MNMTDLKSAALGAVEDARSPEACGPGATSLSGC